MIQNLTLILLLTAFTLTPSKIFANSVSVDIVHSNPTIVIRPGEGNPTPTPAPTVVELSEDWTMEFNHNLVLIPASDIVIPIEIEKPTLTLINNPLGRFIFADGEARSVTRSPVAKFVHPTGTIMNFRPTLFVTLCGFSVNGSRPLLCEYQITLNEKLHSVLPDYQYKHFAVNWKSHLPNVKQVGDLAGVISDFLNKRQTAWDVVIFGYSRGGIFAHEVTKKIIGHSKIKNLHTFLLDPTASPQLLDIYPKYKVNKSPTNHFASLYYDGLPFTAVGGFATIGDTVIQGYDNYGAYPHSFNSTHIKFANDWVVSTGSGSYGLDRALIDIKTRKDSAQFAIDGDSGLEVVKIRGPSDLNFSGSISVSGDQVNVAGHMSVGEVPGSTVSINANVNTTGVDVAAVVGTSTAHLVANSDQIAISESNFFQVTKRL